MTSKQWQGPLRHYDIVKEAVIAVAVVALLSVVLAVVFSSPDKRPVTLKAWADAQPVGFVDIAVSELDRTSTSATYGPPYNRRSGSVQSLGPLSLQRLSGVRIPIDPATSFVLAPLRSLPFSPSLQAALERYASAGAAQRARWERAYASVLSKLPLSAPLPALPAPGSGAVPTMMGSLLAMARSGALDAALVTHGGFYNSDYTDPLLFLGDSATAQDGSYWNRIVTAEHLQGSQWGVMNETGSWPGQPWLWLYTMWYQVPPMNSSGNVDILVFAIMALLSLLLLVVPFVPGLRAIPQRVPLHRVIWRRYYRDYPHPA
ncbi:MAG: hypothetical protein ACYC1D_07500 [Acidimicrobiales bacterium]